MRVANEVATRREAGPREEEDEVTSMCTFSVGDGVYGIDSRRIREVLRLRDLHPVPLAPRFVAGVIPYRGEVLTAVSFRALLQMEDVGHGLSDERSCVLVFEACADGEPFGLVVDSVGGVMAAERDRLEPNPGTLDARSLALFDGAYRMTTGLIVHLNPDLLQPERLAQSELFRDRNEESVCGR